MTISSGQIPYQYTGSYPWRMHPSGEILGFSGIVMEEAMFVAIAELRRYADQFYFQDNQTTSVRNLSGIVFQNYQNVSGSPPSQPYLPIGEDRSFYAIEPSISGANLGGIGNINTTDWIQDLRQAFSGISHVSYSTIGIQGIWALINDDCDDDYRSSWLSAKLADIPIHQTGNGVSKWVHEYFTLKTPPPFNTLGASGILYDIDFDEVYFQPFPRFAKTSSVIAAGTDGLSSLLNEAGITIDSCSPIFPNFATTDGFIVTMSNRDSSINFPRSSANSYSSILGSRPVTLSGLFNYSHVTGGFVRIDGDVLLSTTKYDFGGSDATFDSNTFRRLSVFSPENYFDYPAINRAFVIVPANPNGVLASVVTVSLSDQTTFPPSGAANSTFPSQRISGGTITNGFEYLNDALWLSTRNLDHNTDEFYGFSLVSPLTRKKLWTRFGPALGIDPLSSLNRCIISKFDMHRDDSNNTIVALSGSQVTGASSNRRTHEFIIYDNNFEIATNDVHATTIGGHGFSNRFWINSTQALTYNRRVQSGVLDVYDFPSFTNGVSYRRLNVDPSVVLENGGTDNNPRCGVSLDGIEYLAVGTPAVFGRPIGFAPLSLNPDPTNGYDTFDIGPFEAIDGTEVGFSALQSFEIHRIEVIDSAIDFNTGIWMLLGTAGSINIFDPMYLCRIERESGVWKIKEFYANVSSNIPQSSDPTVLDIDFHLLKLPLTF